MTVPNSFTSFWIDSGNYNLGNVHDFVLDHFRGVGDTKLFGGEGNSKF